MIKISATEYTIYFKNYIILTEINHGNGYFIFKKISEKINNYFLSKLILLSDKFTFQTTVSPFSSSSISLMTLGIEVDNVPPVVCTLVLYFNSIPPYILLILFILLY